MGGISETLFDYCMRNKNKKYLLDEWNYSKNIGINPKSVTKAIPLKVWWKDKYGHEWQGRINDRVYRGSNCPFCSGQRVLKGFNDLATLRPDIAKQWHPIKNGNLKPTEVTAHSTKKVWWLCDKGHEWLTFIYSRNKPCCPYCEGKKVLKGFNDLVTTNPELLKEWDYSKNNIKPEEVSKGSHQKVWWICEKGHSWEAIIKNRVNGSYCPKCRSEKKTSFSEQTIYFYIKQIFPDAINSYYIGENKSLDIFIPLLKLGIEYDGRAWHQNLDLDERKNKLCRDNKIKLIRIREEGCPKMNENTYLKIILCKETGYNTCIFNLNESMVKLFKIIEQLINKKIKIDINIDRDRNKIYSMYKQDKYEKSLEYLRPDLLKEWDYELNNGIEPSMVTLGSKIMVYWVCPNGHKYSAIIKNRTLLNSGCPYCINRKCLQGYNDLVTTHPNLIKEWDFDKNEISPYEVTKGSKKKVWWKCSKGHSFEASINSRIFNNTGCPQCAVIERSIKQSKKVINLDTGKIYNSVNEATKSIGLKSTSDIPNCCKGKAKTAGGYHWAYYEEKE